MDLKTEPKPRFPKDFFINPATLTAGRYGTKEMVEIWGPEKTFEYSLKVQAKSSLLLSELHPDIVPPHLAREISEKANLIHINPNLIRELEEKTRHDVIAINTALGSVVSNEAGAHINKAKTSADTTQPAKSLQLKESLKIIADSIENLRDISIEKSLEWIDKPHMDTSHLYDALPTTAGRPFSHYIEMLQSNLNFLKFIYDNSIVGKWGDATGNHHSATSFGIDGIKLQKEYCEKLGIGFMDAPAQVPGLEFEANIFFIKAILGETMNNIAKYIAWGKSDDVNIFFDANPKKRKGSSAMPHKDAKGGNPIKEEQVMSNRNFLVGNLVTAMMNCEIPYARNLAASSNSRINFEDGFKFLDHSIRELAKSVYWLGLNEERCLERVKRSYGVSTSQQIMNYLTDPRKVRTIMTRKEAHDLMGKLATHAWNNKIPFTNVLLENEEITNKIDREVITQITDPLKYIGQSKEIIKLVADKYYKKKTLEENKMNEEFKKVIQSNTGCAIIMAGSDSDKPHIEKITKSLKKYEIPHEVRICSAHKQPNKLMEMVNEYNSLNGSITFIAVAGGTDALSGTLSFHTLGPVISCPPDAPNYSCLTNPPGSSCAYVAKPANVGKIVAQIYASVNPTYREKLNSLNQKKITTLEQKDIEINLDFLKGKTTSKESLTKEDTRNLILNYMKNEEVVSTQEILDSGVIPKLKGYVVKPGKVSDSIFGGKGSYTKKTGEKIEFENPPLETKEGRPIRIMVRTQKISTHDIGRGEIPLKDQVLAMNHNYMRKILKKVIGTSQFEVQGLDDNSVVVAAEDLKQISFENVTRAYMAKSSTETSLYQHFIQGKRVFCGHTLPETLVTNGILPYIMDTPSTKSEIDESIPPGELFAKGICSVEQYNQIKNSSLAAFGIVSEFLRTKGLILVDTKTEHGINKDGEIVSQDELYTMDSSRFWLLEDYNEQVEKLKKGEIKELSPKSYSKEFARGFSKKEQGYTEEERIEIAIRYIEGIQHLLSKKFEPDMRSGKERIIDGLNIVVKELVN